MGALKAWWLAKVVIVDGLLALAASLVLSDIASRVSYAQREGLAFTFSYSPFYKTSDLAGRGSQLISPPTLDWIQVILLIAAVANVLFFTEYLRDRRRDKASPAPPPP